MWTRFDLAPNDTFDKLDYSENEKLKDDNHALKCN
jgi:hypothetical protein